MPDKFGWPALPSGARWLNEDESAGKTPNEQTLSPQQIEGNVGSVLRQIMGPPKPEPAGPRFFSDVVEPVARKATAIPRKIVEMNMDPVTLGTTLAATILTGPMAPGVKAISAVAPRLGDAVGALGATGLRRVLGMAGAGAVSSVAAGQGAMSGAVQGGLQQLIGGEGARKLSQFVGMSYQAAKLAVEDPEKLGKVVLGVIPSLGKIRSPREFFAAFKKSAAQTAVSDAYRKARGSIVEEVGQKVIQSPTMQQMRGNPALVSSGVAGLPPGVRGMGAHEALGGPGGAHSFDDVLETMKRLRTQGYTEDEVKSGLVAMTARDRAAKIETELLSQLTQDQADKVVEMNSRYARGQRIIDLFDDPNLLKKGKEELNIPALQKKYLSMGYNVGQSYAMAADAANLEAELFRGGPLGQDIPGTPGKLLGHGGMSGRGHGFLSMMPKLPVLTKYAGRENTGLSPFSSSVLSQMFRKGISPANTLKAPEE